MEFILHTLPVLAALFLALLILWRALSRFHALPCPVWLHGLVELDNPFLKTYQSKVIISRLDIHPGMIALDAGCGPGRLTIPMAQSVGPRGQVVAVDIQEGMLRRARDKAGKAGLDNILFIHAGLGDGALGLERFDRAALVTVLGEIPNREAALMEIFNSLKPGGVLSVTEIVLDPHYVPRSKVARLAMGAGFTEKEFFGGWAAFTMNLEKPAARPMSSSGGQGQL